MIQTARNVFALALVSVLLLTSCATINTEDAVGEKVTVKANYVYFDFPAATPLKDRADAATGIPYGVSLSLPDSTTFGIFRAVSACLTGGTEKNPWVGVTSPKQSDLQGDCLAFNNLGGSLDIYDNGVHESSYNNAITIASGRHNTPRVADQWSSVYGLFNNPSEHMYATSAVNTDIDALAMKTASGVNTSGFADQMNFWAITNMTFNMRDNSAITCPNVMVGSSGSNKAGSKWGLQDLKAAGVTAGKAIVTEVSFGGPENPIPDILLDRDIGKDLINAVTAQIDNNTWWFAQMNSKIDDNIQGFVVPSGGVGNTNGVNELALSCTDQNAKKWLVLLRPYGTPQTSSETPYVTLDHSGDPPSDSTDNNDHIQARLVPVTSKP